MSVRIRQTESVCPVCLKKINAGITVGEDRMVHMEKTCDEHGSFDTLVWEGDVISYLSWAENDIPGRAPLTAVSGTKGCPCDCGFCQEHQSEACCVLLELTSRCNLHCPVCFASAGEEGTDLPVSEIIRQYDWLIAHGGPYNIQLSGGEPTMRSDLDEIIRLGKERGFTYFQLNSNGLRIAGEDGYAAWLKEAGVSCVFLQFDSLNDEINLKLRGRRLCEIKDRAVRNCISAGLPVVLVPVIAPGMNENEIGAVLQYALEHHPGVRGVHFQPLSCFGRCEVADVKQKTQWRITIPRMLKLIEEQTGGLMKASDFSGGGTESAYCSFHASYRKTGTEIRALARRERNCCCPVPSTEAMDFVSRQWGREEPQSSQLAGIDTSVFDEFLKQAVDSTFTVSGMLFQDAWNLDFSRLRRCYIAEADSERGMVPFCAYNLTDISGKALYRK